MCVQAFRRRCAATARDRGTAWGANTLLILLTAIVYFPVYRYPFVSYDDPMFVSANPQVLRGVTWNGIKWAITTGIDGNWIPITWLSHMVAVQFFNLDPGPHHLINVALHGINACLLFQLLMRLTGFPWRSAAVAALFALHPLRVESVVWITERKDVLYALFWLLAMLAYLRYRQRRNKGTYIGVAVLFTCSLMAKPMAVTLPVVLLLLDYWIGSQAGPEDIIGSSDLPNMAKLLWEKIPLVMIAFIVSLFTIVFQKNARAVTELDWHGLYESIANACFTLAQYPLQFFVPTHLAVFYPFPSSTPFLAWGAAAALIVVITGVAIRQRRLRPYLFVGWGWYLVTVFPVIGIIPVGAQGYADRYTYLPLIGIGIMTVWSCSELVERYRLKRTVTAAIMALPVAAGVIISMNQVAVWKDSVSLYEHALAVTKDNWLAHNNLAAVLIQQGNLKEADRHLAEALHIRPGYAKALANRGLVASREGRHREAIRFYVEAIAFMPFKDAKLYSALGEEFLATGYREGVLAVVRELSTLDPDEAKRLEKSVR